MAAALDAVDPSAAIKGQINLTNDLLSIGENIYNLSGIDRIFLVSFGKASLPMASATIEILGDKLTQGIAIYKSIPSLSTKNYSALIKSKSRFTIFEGSHPVPDESNLFATKNIIELLSTTTRKDLVIILISGGGSALLISPVKNITLKDLQLLTQSLLSCGANINQINCLRKHLSKVKGGLLARLSAPAHIAALILSDVINDPLDVIASGPTVPDPTSFGEALSILGKFDLTIKIPPSILDYLTQGVEGKYPETPKFGDPIFTRVSNTIIGNNKLSCQAAKVQAVAEGYKCFILSTRLQGEARVAGRILGSIAKQITTSKEHIFRPACLIAGGETTVTLTGNGHGGRNQELALASSASLQGLSNTMLITLATDGEDGPTDAAGAVVTGKTLDRGRSLGLDADEFLLRNDSYHYFHPLGDLIITGPTGTNVCDLTLLFLLNS
jgi:hydroxypyruvate reductase